MSASSAPSATAGASAPSSSPSSGTQVKKVKFDAETLSYHLSLLTICLLGLFIVFRSIRTLSRLFQFTEWKEGSMLWYSAPKRSNNGNRMRPIILHTTHDGLDTKQWESEDSHTLTNHLAQVNNSNVKPNYPFHIPACNFSFLAPLVSLFGKRVSPGISFGQICIMAAYAVVVFYWGLYKSNPFTDPVRAGWIAIAQTPFVFAFAVKNNVVAYLLGVGYEKLNYLHRFAGRIVVLAVNVHALGYFYKWLIAGTFMTAIAKPANMWGFIGLIGGDLLFFGSLASVRQRCYGLFIFTHLVGVGLWLAACYLHKPDMIPYMYAAAALYGLDRLLRILKTRITRATIRPLPQLGITRVEIPGINAGWRAGQHVRLRVISGGMGMLGFGWAENHPFTIASCAHGGKDGDGMVLMVKKIKGGWTEKLYNRAQANSKGESGASSVQVIVEGPYGGPGNTIFASFSAALFVVGGSGISFAMAAIEELVRRDLERTSRVKMIELVWVVQDPSSLTPLVPLFSSLIAQSVFVPIKINVHYTRATSVLGFKEQPYHPNIQVSCGRPNLVHTVEDIIACTLSAKGEVRDKGLVVGVCGPVALGDQVAKDIGSLDEGLKAKVGGVEIHEETFGW